MEGILIKIISLDKEHSRLNDPSYIFYRRKELLIKDVDHWGVISVRTGCFFGDVLGSKWRKKRR